jgi:hypothetical protein
VSEINISPNLEHQLQAQIDLHGVVSTTRERFIRRLVAARGPSSVIPPSRTIAARLARPDGHQPRTPIVKAGAAPEGFGQVVDWNPADEELLLQVFLNAADSAGVMITGARPTDTLEFLEADGLASFAEETKYHGIGGLIAVVAAGANLVADAFNAPEAKGLIRSAEAFAKDQFKEATANAKVRTPIGEDAESGKRARQEGGVVVRKPGTGRLYYSGNSDHEERWIQMPGTRIPEHYPAHVPTDQVEFLRDKHLTDRRRIMSRKAGDFVLYPWDSGKFEDNKGFYRLRLHLRRGNGKLPDIT